ncbi:very-long-chain 3-oxoacyl-CoA reductase 1-like [Pyrus x bretschneideri]|uniref:very-long-chain 3-oxoacyl-CoA reductase 1-like n=1 Tax=Pyrus x bretschneideri TaxID=225117 RepID=UPI00202E6A34|nr:very-long-chain 3-oxoacyl-CoA reductase 1-like [Pyrus x bretschneideri]
MELHELFIAAASTLGFISLCKSSFSFLRWVWVMFLRPPKNLKEYGSWALVTGSADGIGRALAFEMASKGLNLVLLDRNTSKLEATSNELREKYGGQIDVKNIVMDLSKFSGEEIADAIEEEIKGLDVGILVNNAGVAYRFGKFLHEVDDLEVMESIKVNMEAATWITKALLPGMLKKKKGAIVNLGSASHAVPSFPLFTNYASSKSYLSMLSRSISLEYKQHGIDIQCQIPMFVATKLTMVKATPFFFPSPETYGKASMRWIGYEHHCSPYWGHSVQWLIVRTLPDAFVTAVCFWYTLRLRKIGQLKRMQQTTRIP